MAKAKDGPPRASKKRARESKPYEDKRKIVDSFGCFDTENTFEAWRQSPLVKPWWDLFVDRFLETDLFTKGQKVADFENLYTWIVEGERRGNRKFMAQRESPAYHDATDWHAWLTFRLVEENKTDRHGCFYNSRMGKKAMFKVAYHYILFAKRERARALANPKASKTSKTKKGKGKAPLQEPEMSPEVSETEEKVLDPTAGIAIVTWTKGIPLELEIDEDFKARILVKEFCGHSLMSFWQEVDARFELKEQKQRRKTLNAEANISFSEAQAHAYENRTVKFALETEAMDLAEEADPVPEAEMPLPGDALEADDREERYQVMVDEAIRLNSSRMDMGVRLWQYNLMLAEANTSRKVTLRDVVLDLGEQESEEVEADAAAMQAIQYSHDIRTLNVILSDPDLEAQEDTVSDANGPPLTKVLPITAKEIAEYRDINRWTDNPLYQPQNHDESCKRLGIPNPEKPRMEGFIGNTEFDRHQPTGINAMVEFEEGCVQGGLLGEDVGLGKTIQTVGLLVFRSNERRRKIKNGEAVPKAQPTIVIMPQNLVAQWRDEICQFTDRFTILMYYGAGKKSSNDRVVYLPAKGKGNRLTRDHKYFNGDESNSDLIILTSYATWAARHGPKVQWKWLVQRRSKEQKLNAKEAAQSLKNDGITYHSIDHDCPHQMHGLFVRSILDEGHQIRHQSEEIGWAVNSIGAQYRHVLSGTPTFNELKEICGLVEFIQNPNLQDESYLRSLGFTDEYFASPEDETSPLEAVLYKFDPYSVSDTDKRAPLKYCSEAMIKYIFNSLIAPTMTEQGTRVVQVLKKLMVRRTHSSKLNGVSISETLPAVQRLVYECEFTEQERAHYDAAYADTSTVLFQKTRNSENVEWNTTTYRKLCLLSSWLGFQYLLNYKASKLASMRKNMSALSILQDLRKGQQRKGIPAEAQIPVDKKTDPKDVQKILAWHCKGAPKLLKLLGILAEIVVLRQEKVLIWVSNPAQSEWLYHVLRLVGIDAYQLRTDLRQAEHDKLMRDFNYEESKANALICSYMVSCSGLNLQKLCRTTIEYEPPPNDAIRVQEIGRIKRRGQPASWVRHISLLTKDTFNTKQDSDAILKSLPKLLTQLNMDVWGSKDEEAEDHVLGDFVLWEDRLYPANDAAVAGKKLDILEPDDLLYHISMQILGRKPEGNVEDLRRQVLEDRPGTFEQVAEKDPLWT